MPDCPGPREWLQGTPITQRGTLPMPEDAATIHPGNRREVDPAVLVSVVAPAYNEAENLAELVREVREAMPAVEATWEMVIANDGSTDHSAEVLRQCMAETPELRVVNMVKNSGQTAALDAAMRSARGVFLAMLDADRQNDPAEIPRLLSMIRDGQADMVNGWRAERNDPWMRLVSTKIANGVRNWLTSETIHDSACGLKVMRRQCIERLKLFNGMHRFLPTLVRMEGYTVIEVPVKHRPRVAGVAKYGVMNRVFRALRDTFAIRWMRSRLVRWEAREVERNDD